jgi:hypothetical protein
VNRFVLHMAFELSTRQHHHPALCLRCSGRGAVHRRAVTVTVTVGGRGRRSAEDGELPASADQARLGDHAGERVVRVHVRPQRPQGRAVADQDARLGRRASSAAAISSPCPASAQTRTGSGAPCLAIERHFPRLRYAQSPQRRLSIPSLARFRANVSAAESSAPPLIPRRYRPGD